MALATKEMHLLIKGAILAASLAVPIVHQEDLSHDIMKGNDEACCLPGQHLRK